MGCRHSLHRVSIGPVTVQIDSFINQASRATLAICPAKQQSCLQLWPINWPKIYMNKSLCLASSPICQLTSMDSKLSKILPFTQIPQKVSLIRSLISRVTKKGYQPEHICGHADVLRCLESKGECDLSHKIPSESESPTASWRSSDSAMRSADASKCCKKQWFLDDNLPKLGMVNFDPWPTAIWLYGARRPGYISHRSCA